MRGVTDDFGDRVPVIPGVVRMGKVSSQGSGGSEFGLGGEVTPVVKVHLEGPSPTSTVGYGPLYSYLRSLNRSKNVFDTGLSSEG